MSRGRWSRWPRYVPVAERRAKAERQMKKLRKQNKDTHPVEIEGRTIARSFWGKGWCQHLESFSDYENRLPRGRTYARNGLVCHLEIKPGRIEAIVAGSSLYQLTIKIKKLKPSTWKSIKEKCAGQIGSILELLQGKLSDEVMTIVSERENGLFPQPSEITLDCSCPDWAVMCKHVAAALYGVGNRLDEQPDLLFLLRDVDAEELISAEMALPELAATGDALSDDQLGDIFDIDLAEGKEPAAKPSEKPKPKRQWRDKKPKVSSKRLEKPPATKEKSQAIPTKRSKTSARTNCTRRIGRTFDSGRRQKAKSTVAKPRIRPTGKSVARLRKHLGFSPAQFAKKLGVSVATVYKWEATAGRLKLRARSLNALATLSHQIRKQNA